MGWEWWGRGGSLVVKNCRIVRPQCAFSAWWPHLSVGALLQRGLHHHVALHAHLQLRDVGGDVAVAGGPQRAQELAPPDGVHDHRPVLGKNKRNKGFSNTPGPRLPKGTLQTCSLLKPRHGNKCSEQRF